ncbi:MAG: GtrA family protein [Halobacteriaceae archaeon]
MVDTDQLGALVAPERAGKFVSVGVLGAVCDMTVITLLVEGPGLQPWAAKIVSAEAAIVLMFVINERWTFTDHGDDGGRALARRFLTSNLVRAGGAAVAWAVLVVLTSVAGVWYLAANVAGIGTGFVVNYAFESLLTWQVHE